jgi:hypothetical protein
VYCGKAKGEAKRAIGMMLGLLPPTSSVNPPQLAHAVHQLMKTFLIITHGAATGNQKLHFDALETPEEVRNTYHLRYHVYVSQKRYSPASYCADGFEMDASDHADGCTYFIASCGAQAVGTVRLIHQRPLPIETHWRYELPSDLRESRSD